MPHLKYILRRLALWLFARIIARANNITVHLQVIAITRLRTHFDAPLAGEDEVIDGQLLNATHHFFNTPADESELNGEERKYLNWLQRDEISNSDRELSLRISHWLYLPTDKAAEIASSYKRFRHEDIVPIRTAEIWRSFREVRRRSRHELHLLRESRANLILFSLKEMNLALPWISILFVFSGYVHISILYGHFGLEPSNFFSIGDYLASSISQVPHAVYGVVGLAMGVIHVYRNLPAATEPYRKQQARRSLWSSGLMFVVCAGLSLSLYAHSLMLPLIPVFAMGATGGVVMVFARKYFRNPIAVYVAMMFLVGFFTSMLIGAHESIVEIEGGENMGTFVVKTTDAEYSSGSSQFMGSNSKYVFLYVNNEGIKVIPLDEVTYLSFE